jgi:hypothetical protein
MKVGDLFIFIYSNKEFHFSRVESIAPATVSSAIPGKYVLVPGITILMLYPDQGELRQFALSSPYYKRFEALIKGNKSRVSKRQVIRKAFNLN